MEGHFFDICKICNKSMIDPRILPCSHSFCLRCLESSNTSNNNCSSCPSCAIVFDMPQGGLMNLKKNEFIESLKNLRLSNANFRKKEDNNLNADGSDNYS